MIFLLKFLFIPHDMFRLTLVSNLGYMLDPFGSTFRALSDQKVANMSSNIDAILGIERSSSRRGPSPR